MPQHAPTGPLPHNRAAATRERTLRSWCLRMRIAIALPWLAVAAVVIGLAGVYQWRRAGIEAAERRAIVPLPPPAPADGPAAPLDRDYQAYRAARRPFEQMLLDPMAKPAFRALALAELRRHDAAWRARVGRSEPILHR